MTRRKRRTKRADSPKLTKAKAIVSALTTKGAQRSTVVASAVARAGISVRTYRTARKQLGTLAIRTSAKRRRRGAGKWYAKRR